MKDVKSAVSKYRHRMQSERYFRDGKQYFALDRATVTVMEELKCMLVRLLLACCVLLLAGLRAPWSFRRLGLLRLV